MLAAALSWSTTVMALNAARCFTKVSKKTQTEIAGWLIAREWVLHCMG